MGDDTPAIVRVHAPLALLVLALVACLGGPRITSRSAPTGCVPSRSHLA